MERIVPPIGKKKILGDVLEKRPKPLALLQTLGKSNVLSLSTLEHIFHRSTFLSIYFIASGIAMHQSLFSFVFTSITSFPGHSAHFKYLGNAKYFKLIQIHNLWFELKMYTPSSTRLPVFRKLEKKTSQRAITVW